MPQRIDERRLAFFGALCLFLSTLEYLIPKPLPFLRVGLANLPILLCLAPRAEDSRDGEPLRFILALVCLKIAGQAIVGGTLFSYVFLFSTAGSLASAAVMLASCRLFGQKLSLAGIGVLGSLGSNAAQILFARYLLLGEGAWLIAPFLFLLGTASGFLLGVFAQAVREHSPWLVFPENGVDDASISLAGEPEQTASDPAAFFSAACGFVSVFPFVFSRSLAAKLVCTAFYMALAAFQGKRIRLLPNCVLTLTVTAAHCLQPFGKVLFTLGSLPITEGAVHAGLFRSTTLIGLVYLSRLAVRPTLRFPGRAGKILSACLRDFERITGSHWRPDLKNLWASLDRLLAAAYSSRAALPAVSPRMSLKEAAAGLVFTFCTWAVFVYCAL